MEENILFTSSFPTSFPSLLQNNMDSNQWDQMVEYKSSPSFPNRGHKVAIAGFTLKEMVFKMGQNVDQ